MADAQDLKSWGCKKPCGFESHHWHQAKQMAERGHSCPQPLVFVRSGSKSEPRWRSQAAADKNVNRNVRAPPFTSAVADKLLFDVLPPPFSERHGLKPSLSPFD